MQLRVRHVVGAALGLLLAALAVVVAALVAYDARRDAVDEALDAEAADAPAAVPGVRDRRPTVLERLGHAAARAWWNPMHTSPEPTGARQVLVPPRLGEPTALTVRVVGEGGRPLEGARVLVVGPPGATAPPAAVTAADGRVVLGGLPAAPSWVVHAVAGDRTATRVVDLPAPGGDVPLAIDDRAGVDGGLDVTVVDVATGAPRPGVEVQLTEARRSDGPSRVGLLRELTFGADAGAPWGRATTGPDGVARLPGPRPRAFRLTTTAADGAGVAGWAQLDADGDPLLPTAVQPFVAARRVRGRVVDDAGAPVPGAEVVGRRPGYGLASAPARTAEDGGFDVAVPFLDGAPVTVVVRLDDGRRVAFEDVPEDGAEPLVVGTGAPWRVTAVDRRTGRPVHGARVLARIDPEVGTGGPVAADVRADGDVVALPLPRGRLRAMWVEAPGYAVGDVEAGDPPVAGPAPDGAVQLVPLDRVAVVVGRVEDPDGRPLAGVRVAPTTGRGPPTTTGSDGRFRVAPVTAHGAVGAASDGGPWSRGTADVEIGVPGVWSARGPELPTHGPSDADGTVDVGAVRAPTVAWLVGRVVDAEGRPVRGATVRAAPSPRSSWRPAPVSTDADGRWAAPVTLGPPVRATCTVTVAAAGFRAATQEVVARLVPSAVREVRTVVLRREARVRVRVVGPDGRPTAARVEAASEPVFFPATDGWFAVPTDAEGRAELAWADDALPLRVHLGGTTLAWGLQVPDTATFDAEVQVPPRTDVDGTVRDARGAPVAHATVRVEPEAVRPGVTASVRPVRADAAGAFRLRGVVGTPTVRVRADGCRPALVRLVAGAPGPVRVELHRITDAERARVAEIEAELARRATDPERRRALRAERDGLLGDD